jgi:hypothetical protein
MVNSSFLHLVKYMGILIRNLYYKSVSTQWPRYEVQLWWILNNCVYFLKINCNYKGNVIRSLKRRLIFLDQKLASFQL